MITCRVHHTKTALMLLCFGADHTHQNEFLETAFDLAIAVDPEREKEFALNFDRELGNEFGSYSTYGASDFRGSRSSEDSNNSKPEDNDKGNDIGKDKAKDLVS